MKEETKELLIKKLKEIVSKFPETEISMLELWQIIIDDEGDKGIGGMGVRRTPQDDEEQELQRKIKSSETIIVSIGLFNPYHWSKEERKKDNKKQQILTEILRQRLMILKKLYVNIRLKNVSGFIECEFLKTDNPDWKEKLENFVRADKEFCEQKTKELEPLNLKDAFTEDLNNRGKGGPSR